MPLFHVKQEPKIRRLFMHKTSFHSVFRSPFSTAIADRLAVGVFSVVQEVPCKKLGGALWPSEPEDPRY